MQLTVLHAATDAGELDIASRSFDDY
jgi:hypothetical protein